MQKHQWIASRGAVSPIKREAGHAVCFKGSSMQRLH
jgi:hypothetical protein